MNENGKKRLHYEVMGIALTLLVYRPDSMLFDMLDDALSGPDWQFLDRVMQAFSGLHPRDRSLLMWGDASAAEVERAASRLEFDLYLDDAWQEFQALAPERGSIFLH